jgi:uncharacterized protein
MPHMTISDRIYGEIIIDDPFIQDLILSGPMQRLRHISQDGATHFIVPELDGTRFEHSVGAWYLAHRFNRPVEEQVASLLHDVPHTAFSHVVDFVMDNRTQTYHDNFLKQVVLASDIPDICAKHGINVMKVLAKEDYYLLDNHTPELSFDRWDYFMRDGYMIGLLPRETVSLVLDSARLHDGQFCFDDIHVAGLLCIVSMAVSQAIYTGATSYGSYCLLAPAIKRALAIGCITEQDLFTTDHEVYAALQASKDPEITGYLVRLQPGRLFKLSPKRTAEFYGFNKARYIDPLVRRGDTLTPVSQLVIGLAERVEAFRSASKHTGVTQLI